MTSEPGQGPNVAELLSLEERARTELAACASSDALGAWNSTFLGDKGLLTVQLKKVGTLPKEERPAFGQALNRVKGELTRLKEARQEELRRQDLERSLSQDAVDVTLPGRSVRRGRLHVATRVMREITQIFAGLGFQVYRSREV